MGGGTRARMGEKTFPMCIGRGREGEFEAACVRARHPNLSQAGGEEATALGSQGLRRNTWLFALYKSYSRGC